MQKSCQNLILGIIMRKWPSKQEIYESIFAYVKKKYYLCGLLLSERTRALEESMVNRHHTD
jgi:hypothetical protein